MNKINGFKNHLFTAYNRTGRVPPLDAAPGEVIPVDGTLQAGFVKDWAGGVDAVVYAQREGWLRWLFPLVEVWREPTSLSREKVRNMRIPEFMHRLERALNEAVAWYVSRGRW